MTVVVLGDLGRSPRMRYHALALADSGVEVDLIGYRGSALPRELCGHPRIRRHRMEPAAGFLPAEPAERCALFRRLAWLPDPVPVPYQPDSPARPAIRVSATSWTEDENLALLLVSSFPFASAAGLKSVWGFALEQDR